MNEQNAIKDIRENICTGKGSSILCRDECMYGERRCAYQLAIEALEKQIPKKPTSTGGFMRVYHCPSCNAPMGYGQAHCHCCGKKLDWTVEE